MENNIKNEQKISTPMAIIIAGLLIMIGILGSKNISSKPTVPSAPKTLSEQVGISKTDIDACIKNTDMQALSDKINASVASAMKGLPDNQRGTPYNIVIGKNNVMTDIRGALPYDQVKAIIDDAMIGKVAVPYKGAVALSEQGDHVQGNPNAQVTIIEYSDFECPYCKSFQPTMEKIVKDYNGNVKWIYRNFPIHQHSFEKLVAAECVAKLKGNDAYFQYGDLLFGLLQPTAADQTDSIGAQL